MLLLQAAAVWSRKDPLGDVDTSGRAGASIMPEIPKTTPPGNAVHRQTGNPNPALPPAVQSRVERITQSEILGPVMRPLPMALLGLAGEDAFMRAPNGQTGLMRVGDELGGIRLLRIGTNRVLIEHEQQQKELTLFAGFGGEPLLSGERTGPDARPAEALGN
jgi:hypothetical protein